jgi:hypothetical protein
MIWIQEENLLFKHTEHKSGKFVTEHLHPGYGGGLCINMYDGMRGIEEWLIWVWWDPNPLTGGPAPDSSSQALPWDSWNVPELTPSPFYLHL